MVRQLAAAAGSLLADIQPALVAVVTTVGTVWATRMTLLAKRADKQAAAAPADAERQRLVDELERERRRRRDAEQREQSARNDVIRARAESSRLRSELAAWDAWGRQVRAFARRARVKLPADPSGDR